MNARRLATLGLLLAPAAGLATGVWAEWGDLEPPLLLSLALPAIIASTLSAAYLTRALARPVVLVLLGLAFGVLTFGLSEGGYIAIHLSRGGELNFEGYDSQAAMAAALLGIHLAVGAVIGLAVGAALAVVLSIARALRWRERRLTPRSSG